MFVHAARFVAPDLVGADRARSASEAFLYRRLETLRETGRLFRNEREVADRLDAHGGMEVGLLCAESRLAIEIDGA